MWKGFGALFGAYVFAALASRRIPRFVQHARPVSNCVSEQGRLHIPENFFRS
jgi:hypothetical protein